MPPRVRLTHNEVSRANLELPGMTWNLLRKLNIQREQISRGKACTRCRQKKLKCQGEAPCRNCMKAKANCDAEGGGSSNVSQLVPYQSEAEDLWTIASTSMARVERPVCNGYLGPDFSPPLSSTLANLNGPKSNLLHDSFAVYGFRKEFIARMLASLPQRLQVALHRLGAKMAQGPNAPSPLDMMPDKLDVWEGSTVCRQIIKFQENSKLCAHNETISELAGAHPEEIATRMNAAELPPFTSEYRLLCTHLFLLLLQSQGVKQITHFIPMITSFCRRDSFAAPMQLYRVTRTFFQNGVINTGCPVLPEEYDAAVQVCPRARMDFVECHLPGHALSSAHLIEHERISSMVASPEGRGKLERLADTVIEKFGLDIPLTNHQPPQAIATAALDRVQPAAEASEAWLPSPPVR